MLRLYLFHKPSIHSDEHALIMSIAQSWLCQETFDYGTRYRHPNKQLGYYCSRLLIRHALAELTSHHPAEFIISRSDVGGGLQASLPNNTNATLSSSPSLPTFSISHTASTVGLIISDEKYTDIGLDLESRERPVSGVGLSHRYFATAVAEWVAGQHNPDSAFLQIWTQAEALVKAAKTGMGNNTKKMRFAFADKTATLKAEQPIGNDLHLSWHSKTAIHKDLQWSAVVGQPNNQTVTPILSMLSSLAPESISVSDLQAYSGNAFL